MIDSLVKVVKRSSEQLDHCVVTFHRPSNVDSSESLEEIVKLVEDLPCKVMWPVHPRTKNALEKFSLYQRVYDNPNILLTGPKSYVDFINLISKAKCIITDSGGIQEEATYLKVPCITYRTSTERPSTIDSGSNTLSMDRVKITDIVSNIIDGTHKKITTPIFWDGNASIRIAKILQNYF